MGMNIIGIESISTEDLRNELYKRQEASSKTKKRYEIIGIWSGYRSEQRRVVHREYTTSKDFVAEIEKIGFIVYSDGTSLDLSVREMAYRERKQEDIKGYTALIRKCINQGTNEVDKLK